MSSDMRSRATITASCEAYFFFRFAFLPAFLAFFRRLAMDITSLLID